MEKNRKVISSAEYMSDRSSLSRDSVFIAIFGALWGLVEITLGVVIKGTRLPMGGAFLAVLCSIIFLNGRFFVRRRGSILMMGGIAATLKIFSVGTVIAGPFIAILIESLIAETLVSFLGVHRFSYVITANALSVYTILHPFISQGIIFGENIYKIYLETFQKITQLLQLDFSYLIWIILIYVFLHLILGTASGWLAYSLALRVKKEIPINSN